MRILEYQFDRHIGIKYNNIIISAYVSYKLYTPAKIFIIRATFCLPNITFNRTLLFSFSETSDNLNFKILSGMLESCILVDLMPNSQFSGGGGGGCTVLYSFIVCLLSLYCVGPIVPTALRLSSCYHYKIPLPNLI